MRLHRFFLSQALPTTPRPLSITDQRIASQLFRVLRAQPGEQIQLFDSSGRQATAVINDLSPRELTVTITKLETVLLNLRQVMLYCALLKKDNFELVVQKATEVGVAGIVPLVTARTVKQNIRHHRLMTIATEAAEQSGRVSVPNLAHPQLLADALATAVAAGTTLFFHHDGQPWASLTLDDSPRSIFVGPEGGWTPEEVAQAIKAGATIVTLGPLNLRAETAAIVASYLTI